MKASCLELDVDVQDTPSYDEHDLQIDEVALGEALEYKEGAKRHDINSVRSIYVLRGDRRSSSIEKCKAIFVTSNTPLVNEVYKYSRENDESLGQISAAIGDTTLTNAAWLKAPMEAPNLPKLEVLSLFLCRS